MKTLFLNVGEMMPMLETFERTIFFFIVSALLVSSVLIVRIVESRPRRENAPKSARKFLCWYAHLSGGLFCFSVVLAFLAETEMLVHNGSDWWCPLRASLWFLAWSVIYFTLSTRCFKEIHDWRLPFGIVLVSIALIASMVSLLNGITDASYVKKTRGEDFWNRVLTPLAQETLSDGSRVLKMTIGNGGGSIIVYERVDKDTLKPIPLPADEVEFKVRYPGYNALGDACLCEYGIVESWYTYHNGRPQLHKKVVGETRYVEVADSTMIPTRCDEETAFIGPPAPETTGD